MRALAFIMFALAPLVAFAQDASPAPIEGWFDALLPTIAAIATPIVTAVFVWLGALIRKNLNEKTSLILQEIFMNAVKGAAGATINDVDISKVVRQGGIAITDAAVQKGVEVLKNSIPDTLKKLKKSDKELAQRIVNQVANTLVPALASAPPVGADKK